MRPLSSWVTLSMNTHAARALLAVLRPGTPCGPARSAKLLRVVGERDRPGLEHVAAVGDVERHQRVLLDEQDRRPLLVDLDDRSRRSCRRRSARGPSRARRASAARPRHQRAADRAHLLLAARHRPRLLASPLGEPGNSSKTRSMSSLIALLSLPLERAHLEVLETVMRGKSLRPSGDWEMPLRTIVVGAACGDVLALKRIVPRRGWLSPLIERSVVDLPAPFEPISVTISLSLTASEMPLAPRSSRRTVHVLELEDRVGRRRHRTAAVPRYASITRGSACTSTGDPSAIFSP